jgi:hypothetical protein
MARNRPTTEPTPPAELTPEEIRCAREIRPPWRPRRSAGAGPRRPPPRPTRAGPGHPAVGVPDKPGPVQARRTRPSRLTPSAPPT